MKKNLTQILPIALITLAATAAAACNPAPPASPIIPPTEQFGGPQYAAIVLTSDLAAGRQERLTFGVVSRDTGPIQAPTAAVQTYYLPPNTDRREPRQTLTAQFEQWPFAAGVFAANPQFDTAGSWELEAQLTTADGQQITAKSAFTVKETGATPPIGAPARPSITPTAAAVPDLAHITTAPEPDPALYTISIHDALAQNKPLAVTFSTPRYCATGVCGPQVEQLTALRQSYAGRANFIHVEIYQNPHLIEPGQRPALTDAVAAVTDWGLPTEPWTFIIDAQGIIRAKFEAFTPAQVIEAALKETLN